MKFLRAQWKHLLFANYRIDPDILSTLVPNATQIDTFQGDCYVSLVAFLFDRTRILGMPIPFHVRFEEVNLRFYVSPIADPTKRAVTFIKEIVPRSSIPIVANTLFGEHYMTLPMSHRNEESEHEYRWGRNLDQKFSARLKQESYVTQPETLAEFITEHYWGYAKHLIGTLEYRVEHPKWKCVDVNDFDLQVDFESVYGEPFRELGDRRPDSVFYAKGSEVSVSFPSRLIVARLL